MTDDILRVGMLPVTMLGGKPQAYVDKVVGYGPIAYWPLWETSGVTARCLVNPAQNGTYTGVTLSNALAPDGSPCPLFDGTNDYVNVYSATLAGAFDGDEGTIMIFARMYNAAAWPGAPWRRACQFRADDLNRVDISKVGGASQIEWMRLATTTKNIVQAHSETTWMHLALSWSRTSDELRAFFNGNQEGATVNTLLAWVGALSATSTCIGARDTTPSILWYGWLAHCAVWDTALTPVQIADLATV